MRINVMTNAEKNFVEENLEEIDRIISILWKTKFKNIFIPLKLDEEDFVQEARLAVCENIGCYDKGQSSLPTFVTLIVGRRMKSYASKLKCVKRSAHINAVSIDTGKNGIPLADILPDKSTLPSFEKEMVEVLMESATKEDSKIVKLFLCGYNKKEICEHLKISRRHINERLKRMSMRGKERYYSKVKL